jgi:hypothetical protein
MDLKENIVLHRHKETKPLNRFESLKQAKEDVWDVRY